MIVKDKIIDFAGKEHWFIIASHKETIKDIHDMLTLQILMEIFMI